MIFMTIPTAGTRQESLGKLIEISNLPHEQIVLVTTRTDVRAPKGVIQIDDFGPPNIQRWWLRGIEEAERRGAKQVAVANDDISIGPDSLQRMAQALDESGAAIASPSRYPFPDGLHQGDLVPYEPRLWGALWMLDVATDLRPDPRYHWWYGDNDLDIRARSEYGGVVLVPVEYSHEHSGEATSRSSVLQELSEIDAQRFEKQYRRLLAESRGTTQKTIAARLRGFLRRPH